MNRLWVRLTLAFAAVIALTLAASGLLGIPRSADAFRTYLAFSEPLPQEGMVNDLISFYRAQGSWIDVSAVLNQRPPVPRPSESAERPLSFQPRDGMLQVVLADAAGRVVYQRYGGAGDRQLSAEEELAAQDITVDGVVAGRLVVTVHEPTGRMGPLEQRFLARLRDLLVRGAVIAATLGLALGILISRSLSTPLRRLSMAARSVAQRDFASRVPVGGTAEVAELAVAFNEMTEALQHSETQRQQLVADVAHELRTPLTVLQGNLRALLDGVYPLEQAEISHLYDETRLLGRLVDDLRLLALADAGQLPMVVSSLDLTDLVRSIAAGAQAAVEPDNLMISVRLPADLPPVRADRDRVAQVLHNLLGNAIRHTPPGGEITITLTDTGEAIETAVIDSGEGIPPEQLDHIFDRFWRADPSRSRDNGWGGGTGLGLSIAQSLVRAMGGRIWAENEPGHGAILRFTLPYDRSELPG